MPARILARRALRAERGWRGQALVLGLEDMQGIPHYQGGTINLSILIVHSAALRIHALMLLRWFWDWKTDKACRTIRVGASTCPFMSAASGIHALTLLLLCVWL